MQPQGLLQSEDAHAFLALEWMDTLRIPHLIVDQQLSIVWANAEARSRLVQGSPTEIKANTLHVRAPSGALPFILFLQTCERGAQHYPLPGARGDHSLLRVVSLVHTSRRRHWGITIHSDEICPEIDIGLGKLFSLTAAEVRVAHLLLAGLPADQVADKTSVSIETVRTHIRRIYMKLNVSSREGLFRRLRPFLF